MTNTKSDLTKRMPSERSSDRDAADHLAPAPPFGQAWRTASGGAQRLSVSGRDMEALFKIRSIHR
jgi:hypothetical protein